MDGNEVVHEVFEVIEGIECSCGGVIVVDRLRHLRVEVEAAADEVSGEIGEGSISTLAVAVASLMNLSRKVVRDLLVRREQREAAVKRNSLDL